MKNLQPYITTGTTGTSNINDVSYKDIFLIAANEWTSKKETDLTKAIYFEIDAQIKKGEMTGFRTIENTTDESTEENASDEITAENAADELTEEDAADKITEENATCGITEENETYQISEESGIDETTEENATDESTEDLLFAAEKNIPGKGRPDFIISKSDLANKKNSVVMMIEVGIDNKLWWSKQDQILRYVDSYLKNGKKIYRTKNRRAKNL